MVVASVDEVSGLTVARLKEELAARGLSKEGVKVHSSVFRVFCGMWGVATLVKSRVFVVFHAPLFGLLPYIRHVLLT